jgi:hypothetical protein
MAVFSIFYLTTRPALWTDEGISLNIADSFAHFGRLDISTAPGEFSGRPYLLQSTGYPVTVSLAMIFKAFGTSPRVARAYMLVWMTALLATIFIFMRRLFGYREAIFAVMLVATFASFHAGGRTVVGDIPGLVFLIGGLYILLFHESLFLSGVLLGLTVVTKPSIYLTIIPAVFLALMIARKSAAIKDIIVISSGMIPAAAGWFWFVLGGVPQKTFWLEIIYFYQNPFGAVSQWDNILNNSYGIFTSVTLIYFGVLFVVLMLGKYLNKDAGIKFILNFVAIYSILAFIYYLRSPGWLRYLSAAEMLILSLLPYAIFRLVDRCVSPAHSRDYRFLAHGALVFLIGLQFIYFFTGAKIFYSDDALRVIDKINNDLAGKSVGVINVPFLTSFLHSDKKYQMIKLDGIPELGNNLFTGVDAPMIIVVPAAQEKQFDPKGIISKHYSLVGNYGRLAVYIR